jgi:hypothetical protein
MSQSGYVRRLEENGREKRNEMKLIEEYLHLPPTQTKQNFKTKILYFETEDIFFYRCQKCKLILRIYCFLTLIVLKMLSTSKKLLFLFWIKK